MTKQAQFFVGIDVSDTTSVVRVMNEAGAVVRRRQIRNTERAFSAEFEGRSGMRVALEAGTQSMWMERVLRSYGHEVFVANPRQLQLISKNVHKSDDNDAEVLARLVRVDPALLRPIRHRSEDAHRELLLVRARRVAVRVRTELVNSVRGMVKSLGVRLPKCTTKSFEDRVFETLEPDLRETLAPLLELVGDASKVIAEYDKAVAELGAQIPAVQRMQTIPGVGPLTAFAFYYSIDDPTRFQKARDVGAYLGLTPRRSQSGTRDPQLGITKVGDPYLRALLGQCAHRLLGPLTKTPSALRDFGLRKAGEGESSGVLLVPLDEGLTGQNDQAERWTGGRRLSGLPRSA